MKNIVTFTLVVCGLAAAQGLSAAPAEIDFAEVAPIGHNWEQPAALAEVVAGENVSYVFYARHKRDVRFTGRAVGASAAVTWSCKGITQTHEGTGKAPGATSTDFTVPVPDRGWYALRFSGCAGICLEKADVVVALDLTKGATLSAPKGAVTLGFDLPNARYPFAMTFSGCTAARLTDYTSARLFEKSGAGEAWTLKAARGGAAGVAELNLAAAGAFTIGVEGLPAYFFLNKEARWHWSGKHGDPAKQLKMPPRPVEPWDEAGEAAAMQQTGSNAQFVRKVESGAFRRARVSWWGFDPEDSTRFVQEAIDSGVPHLVLDRLSSDWIVTPLFIRRKNLTLEFEDGATLMAKKGAFLPLSDELLRIVDAEDITLKGAGVLRMRQKDYVKPPYIKGEWRACLVIGQSRRVTLDGLRFEDSGGDGITLGAGAVGVTIRNCICDRNFRQGISVCSATDLLIENCVLANTAGTAPAAGIDFEPDHPTKEEIVNCVMRNCISTNNAGSGIDVCLNNLKSVSKPVSLRIENCRFERNSSGTAIRYSQANDCVPGSVVFDNCRFVRERSCGIGIERKCAEAFDLRFERCKILDCGSGNSGEEISFFPTKWSEKIADGIVFNDLAIRQKWNRRWMGVGDVNFADRPKAITGRVFVKDAQGGVTTNVLDAALLAKVFPPDGEKPLPRYQLDYRDIKVVDKCPGQAVALAPISCQSRVCFDFYIAKPGRYTFKMRQVTGSPERAVKNLLGYVHGRFTRFFTQVKLPMSEPEDVVIDFPDSGWHLMWINPSYLSPIQMMTAECPVAINMCEGQLMLRATEDEADLWLDMPPVRMPFTPIVRGCGGGKAEFSLADAAGAMLAGGELTRSWKPYLVSGGAAEGFARLRFSFAPGHAHRSFWYDFTGMPAYLFLSRDKYWHWNGRNMRLCK